MKNIFGLIFFCMCLIIFPQLVYSQQAALVSWQDWGISTWLGFIEFPFLFASIFYSFKTADAFRGSKLGDGAHLLAYGFIIMTLSQVNLQLRTFFELDMLAWIFSPNVSGIVWFLGLIAMWALFAMGVFRIYQSHKQ